MDRVKVICIKSYLFEDDRIDIIKNINVGEIGKVYVSNNFIIATHRMFFGEYSAVISKYIFAEHFMTLAEYRQNRLEEILNG